MLDGIGAEPWISSFNSFWHREFKCASSPYQHFQLLQLRRHLLASVSFLRSALLASPVDWRSAATAISSDPRPIGEPYNVQLKPCT